MKETKLEGISTDIVAENVEKLKELFPEVICEDNIDFDKLKVVLGEYIDNDDERYNFTWWGKSKALQLAQTPSTGTLRPCPEESKDWETTQNLYIEGDNLEVLKLLQKSYHGKIKMIYIDPPYNTGNDFIYPDNYKDNLKNYLDLTGQTDSEGREISTNSESSGRYHTKWLNMMYPRLRAARTLLHRDGVILVSIDEHELANLIKIMNEIYGESNQICIFSWKSRAKPTNAGDARFRPQKVAEYILVYGKKNIEKFKFNVVSSKERSYPHDDGEGKYRTTTILTSNRGTFRRETMRFEAGGFIPNEDYRWKAGKNIIDDLFSRKRIVFNEDGIPVEKKYEDEERDPLYPIYCFIDPEISGTAENGKAELNELLGNKHGMDTVKPVSLIKYLVSTFSNESDFILDFFAGSSTTAQAVLELNYEDNSSRKFILCQFPQEVPSGSEASKVGFTKITDIGKKRIIAASEKILKQHREEFKEQKAQIKNITDNNARNTFIFDDGFRVFSLYSSNLKKWQPDKENIEDSLLDNIDHFKDGRSNLDIVYELMLKTGHELSLPVKNYLFNDKSLYSVGNGQQIICLDDEISPNVIDNIIHIKKELKPNIVRVVFKESGFKDDSVKINSREVLLGNGIEEIVSI